MIEFPSGFKTRDYQDPFFRYMGRGGKRAILIWHRRAGKDLTVWTWTITEAYRTTGIYFYFFPTYSQAKKVIWDGMDNQGRRFLDYIPHLKDCKLNETEMQITLPSVDGGSNGSIIQLVGTDKMDYIVGTNPRGCVFSEYALQNPQAWSLVRPILEANKGWAIFVTTPRGHNHAKALWDAANKEINKKNWFTQRLTIKETCDEDGRPVITDQQIEDMINEGEDPDLVQQEYYCSFSGAQQGAYYSHLVETARTDGRIRRIPFDPVLPVDTFWDIGHADSTVIGFRQIYNSECRWIDCYEKTREGLPHFAHILTEKARLHGYRYGRHYFPHDMQVTEWATKETRIASARRMGIKPATVVERTGLEDGIDAVRRRFNRYYIDEVNCEQLIHALSEYARSYSKTQHKFLNQPEHNWCSHFADMVRLEAMVGNQPTEMDFNNLPKYAVTYFDPVGAIEVMNGFDPFDDGPRETDKRSRISTNDFLRPI